MDGNRRWARAHGLPTLAGHKRGYDKMLQAGEWCLERGVKVLTLYAFSTENWNRSKREVAYLMRLLKLALTREVATLNRRNIKLKVVGRLSGLSRDLQDAAQSAMAATEHNTRGILNIAINYGGRAELVDAVKRIVREKVAPAQVTEQLIERNLYTDGLPDPDLIIRTSGEQRLSGFLTWQSVYSELFFTPKSWPEFSERILDEALDWFSNRGRRFGGN